MPGFNDPKYTNEYWRSIFSYFITCAIGNNNKQQYNNYSQKENVLDHINWIDTAGTAARKNVAFSVLKALHF